MKVVFEENMIIQARTSLNNFVTDHRIWQGIPSVEVTKKGRIFVTFYSGSGGERLGNFSVVIKSDDGGKTFSEPVVVAYKGVKHRCFDPCLWIDPLGRLWFNWAIMPDDGTYATICEDPDADELVWSDSFYVGEDIMMNKPTVLSTGEWYFPLAVWRRDMRGMYRHSACDDTKVPGAYSYKTVDCGKTFECLGGADAGYRDFDEHMIVEHRDDVLATYVRVDHGIGVCYSYDRGKTWGSAKSCSIGSGPTSRFHIRRLKSGRLLLVYHKNTNRRNNLAAFLSEDDGKTWPYSLVLDEREFVSYPDAKEANDGFIYIVYDRERQGITIEHAYTQAREILMAKITEEDIIAGKLVNAQSKLKQIVSKLGKFYDESVNFYEEPARFSVDSLAALLVSKYSDNVIGKFFDMHLDVCLSMGAENGKLLDSLINQFRSETVNKKDILKKIIKFIRDISVQPKSDNSFVSKIKEIIFSNADTDLSVEIIAEKAGVSIYFMEYLFEKKTGITIEQYKREVIWAKAKRMLVDSKLNIEFISQQCGFYDVNSFVSAFSELEKISPEQYRENLSRIK